MGMGRVEKDSFLKRKIINRGKIKSLQVEFKQAFSREEGIRTLDTVARILPFQGSSFNHSDTSLFLGVQR